MMENNDIYIEQTTQLGLDALEEIKFNRQQVLDGNLLAIPFPLPSLMKALPGVERATYYITTANSKVGKTKIADYLFLYSVIHWYMNNPNRGIKPKIIYFTLEQSKREKMREIFAFTLYLYKKWIISAKQLQSKWGDKPIGSHVVDMLSAEGNRFLKTVYDCVVFVDNVRNPTGLYKYVLNYANTVGTTTYKNMTFIRNTTTGVKTETSRVRDNYTLNDPEVFPIVMIDHFGLLTTESGMDLRQTIGKMSSDYILEFRDFYGFSTAAVQQQTAESEKQVFHNGNSVIEKVMPSTDGLGENKTTQRDCNVMLGLFAPFRYKFTKYHGYDLNTLRDQYRELSILINRNGSGNQAVDLFFNGASNVFVELPDPLKLSEVQVMYEYANNIRKYLN